jgi:hypothetical protein
MDADPISKTLSKKTKKVKTINDKNLSKEIEICYLHNSYTTII